MPQRRMHDRYRPLGSAFVIFESPGLYRSANPRIIKMGPVTEISRKGLSVEYPLNKDCQKDFQELSLLVPGQGLVVYRIPFRNISETIVSEAVKRRPIMRRGMQFGELNEYHAGLLEDFVQTYTRGIIPDRRSGYERRNVPETAESYAAIFDANENLACRSGKDRRAGERKKSSDVPS
ncbi:MAG: hypothetical protein ABIK15_12260 [Pseudomonadota bacterium]